MAPNQDKVMERRIAEYLRRILDNGRLDCGLQVQGTEEGSLLVFPAERLLMDGGFPVTPALKKRLNAVRHHRDFSLKIVADHARKKGDVKAAERALRRQKKPSRWGDVLQQQQQHQQQQHPRHPHPHPQFGQAPMFPHPNNVDVEMGGRPQFVPQQWSNWRNPLRPQPPNQYHHQQRPFGQGQQGQRRFPGPRPQHSRPQAPAPEVQEEVRRQLQRKKQEIEQTKESVEKQIQYRKKASMLKKKLEESKEKASSPEPDKEDQPTNEQSSTDKEPTVPTRYILIALRTC